MKVAACIVSAAATLSVAPSSPSPIWVGDAPTTTPTRVWANEPPGMTLESDWDMSGTPWPEYSLEDLPDSHGWRMAYNAAPGSVWGNELGDDRFVGTPRGWLTHVTDPTAPLSPGGVYDFVYPVGMIQGTAPSTVYREWSLDRGTREMYVGFYWKTSLPFHLGTLGQKLAFFFNGGGGAGGQQFIAFAPNGQIAVMAEYPLMYEEPGQPRYRIRYPNVHATTVTLGEWHKIEWYSNLDTGKNQWWLDGVLQGDYDDIDNPVNFQMFQFSPTWGGCCGDPKPEVDHAYFDHVHLSVR